MGAIKLRRHGDLMIKTYEGFKIPEEAHLAKVTLLHRGNNHDHFISRGVVAAGELGGKKYLRVVEPAEVDHIEHGKGDLPVGDYYTEIKSEYDHWTQESRAVID